jgi:hypothetical protein
VEVQRRRPAARARRDLERDVQERSGVELERVVLVVVWRGAGDSDPQLIWVDWLLCTGRGSVIGGLLCMRIERS